ncbi:MAG TPA: septation protein SepH [Streptosporangiaceae bacterium]|jgi:hypothetical protein
MHELRLVAVSEDGSYAVLVVPGRGGRFSLQIDDRLRAVARGQFSRLAQYEIEVESPLRPKEIQERIRAGETAEEIADAAGVPIERVRWFEGPVLAERAYRAEEAQSAMVRRPGDSGSGARLGDVVAERLTALGTSTEDAHWDSIKHNDGTWQVQLLFNSGGRAKTAEWLYDPRRKHVTPTDDEAARLCLPEADLPPEPGESRGATVTPLQPRFSPPAGQGRRSGGRPADQPYQPQPYQQPSQPSAPSAPPEWPAAHRDREPDRAAGYEREPAPAAHREADWTPGYDRDPREASAAQRPAAYPDEAVAYSDEQVTSESHQPRQPTAHYRDAGPGRAPEPARAAEREPDRTPTAPERPATPARHRESDRAATHEREPERVTAREREPERIATRESERVSAREPERAAAQEREAEQTAAAQHTEPAAARQQPEQPAAGPRPGSAQQRKQERNARGRRERVSAQQRRPEPQPEPAEAEAPPAPAAAAAGQEAARPAAAQGGRRAAGGRGRRSSVPSWDEIMFGSSRPRD